MAPSKRSNAKQAPDRGRMRVRACCIDGRETALKMTGWARQLDRVLATTAGIRHQLNGRRGRVASLSARRADRHERLPSRMNTTTGTPRIRQEPPKRVGRPEGRPMY